MLITENIDICLDGGVGLTVGLGIFQAFVEVGKASQTNYKSCEEKDEGDDG